MPNAGISYKAQLYLFQEEIVWKAGFEKFLTFWPNYFQLCQNFIISPDTGNVSLSKQSFPFYKNLRTILLTIEP